MNILIVHDDKEMTSKIKKTINYLDGQVEESETLSIARNLVAAKKYDIVILDLMLPDVAGGDAKVDGGFNFLVELETAAWAKRPGFFVCVTNFDDIENQYKNRIMEKLHSFINTNAPQWTVDLVDKINFNLKRLKNDSISPLSGKKVDYCILTALQKELLPFRDKLSFKEIEVKGDPLTYFEGEVITNEGQKKSVVLCSLNHMGVPHSSVLATKVIYNFSPKFLFMSGICAGLGEEVNLGDLVISSKVYDYSSGKIYDNDSDEVDFKFSSNCYNISVALLQKMSGITSDTSFIANILEMMGDKKDLNKTPKIHIGPVASGPAVVTSKTIVDKILSLDRKIIAIDMESYALFLSREFFPETSSPTVISVKSVSDRADIKKADDFHDYCCDASSSFFIELIKRDILN